MPTSLTTNSDLPSSAFQVLGLKACVTIPGTVTVLNLFFFFFSVDEDTQVRMMEAKVMDGGLGKKTQVSSIFLNIIQSCVRDSYLTYARSYLSVACFPPSLHVCCVGSVGTCLSVP